MTAPNATEICDALHAAKVDLAATLPDTWLIGLIESLRQDERFTHVPVAREESAVAICAGAFCAGGSGVAVMGTSGFMTCVYAITKICTSYSIGIPILMNMRGDVGDEATHHYGNSLYARPVLDALDIPLTEIRTSAELEAIPALVAHARVLKRPVAISLPKPPKEEQP